MIYIKEIKFKKDYEPFSDGEMLKFKDINLLVGDQGAGKSTLIHLLNNAKNKSAVVEKVNELMSSDDRVSTSANKVFNSAFLQDKGMAQVDNDGKITDLSLKNMFGEYDSVFDINHSPDFGKNLVFLDTEAHNPRIKFAEYDSKRPILQELSMICKNIYIAVQNERDKKHVQEIFATYNKNANVQKEDIDGRIINSHRSHGETIMPMLKDLSNKRNCVILLDEPETSLSVRSQYKLVDIIKKIASNNNQLFVATHSPILMESIGEVLSLEHRKWMDSKDFVLTQKEL